MVACVELGRRGYARRGQWPRALVAAGNAVAVFLVFTATIGPGAYFASSDRYFTEVVTQPPSEGLFNAGYQVVNVFPYDQNGQPLKDIQLFDDRGRPLAPADAKYSGWNGEKVRLIPTATSDGESGLNVFPLREQVTDPGYDPQTGESLPRQLGGLLRDAALPDPTQPAVVPVPVPAASATPAVTLTLVRLRESARGAVGIVADVRLALVGRV